MTPTDIQVGKRYINIHLNPKCVFLGIGKRKMWEGKFGNNDSNFEYKHLVIIESPDPTAIGLEFKEGEDCIKGLWDGFQIIP